MKNTTDYEFPDGWGLMTDEQKCAWFEQERARRQAMRQGFTFRSIHERSRKE